MKLGIAAKCSIYVYIMLITIVLGEVKAQDPHFSQYYASPIYTNPAFAGGANSGRINLNYRSQWPSISGTFRTFSASYDEHFDALNGGIGVIVMADEAGSGTLRTTTGSFVYSYQIIINKYVTMRAGVQVGFAQKTIDFSKLTFGDQITPRLGFTRPTQETPITNASIYPNLAAGAVIYSNRFYTGFAVHNLDEPEQGFYRTSSTPLARRFTGHGGLIIPHIQSKDPKKAANFYPNVLAMSQGPNFQINLGMFYNRGPVVFGGYLRQTSNTTDAFIILFGVRTPKVKVGFSYDATLSSVAAKQSYEISMGFDLTKRTRKKTIRNIRCPEF